MSELNLKEIFNIFWSRKIQMLIIVAIFVVIGIIYSYVYVVPKYQAETQLILVNSTNSNNSSVEDLGVTTTEITLNQKLVATYSTLIKGKNILDEVINNLGIDISANELKNNITVKSVNSTEIISITVTDYDPVQAKNIANELASVFTQRVAKEIYNIDNVHIVYEAEEPTVPYNVSHTKDLFMFGLIGVIVAIGYAIVLNMLDTTIKNKEENIKWVRFTEDERHSLISNLGKAVIMSIGDGRYSDGKHCYILRNKFEQEQKWELWIDKETGLPIKEINRDGQISYIAGTDIVKEVKDFVQDYKYEFDIVTDDDVKVPDYSTYKVEYKTEE